MLDTKDIEQNQSKVEINPQTNQETINKVDNDDEKDSLNENKIEENSNGKNGRWGKKEHIRFLAGCLLYKNNWKKVETYVRTRTSTQIRSHAQKYLKKLEKKYFLQNSGNKSPNDSFNDDFNDLVLTKKEKDEKDEINIKERKDNKESENNDNINNNKENEENKEDKMDKSLKNDEFLDVDNKLKLSDEKIKQIVDDLNKEKFDVETVEKIIINIFRPNKKCEEITKTETKKTTQKVHNTHVKQNKNIFLCQKQKREINYESKIRDLLNSNNPNDLQQLIRIYKERNSHEYDILIYLIENN